MHVLHAQHTCGFETVPKHRCRVRVTFLLPSPFLVHWCAVNSDRNVNSRASKPAGARCGPGHLVHVSAGTAFGGAWSAGAPSCTDTARHAPRRAAEDCTHESISNGGHQTRANRGSWSAARLNSSGPGGSNSRDQQRLANAPTHRHTRVGRRFRFCPKQGTARLRRVRSQPQRISQLSRAPQCAAALRPRRKQPRRPAHDRRL
jgi:hypothetical protein